MIRLFSIIILSLCFTFSKAQVFTLVDSFPGSGGVKLGPDGHIYIGNFGDALTNANGTQIWRYHIQEDSLELFASGLSGASGNDFGPDGNFYQSNIASGVISKVSPSGQVSTYASGLSSPVGIVSDEIGNLYVCECGSNEISKIDTNGVVSLFSSGFFVCPNGITRDHNGNLYVSNFNDSNVIKISPLGQDSSFAFIPGNNNGHLTYSQTDSSLYVTSHGSSKVYKVSLSGTVSVIAGSGVKGNLDGPLNQATFSRPNGIAMCLNGDTIFLNSSIPTANGPIFPLNPSKLRMITGFRNMTTSIPPEEEKIEFNVFPNPANNRIEIIGLESGEYDLIIRSQKGITVFEKEFSTDGESAVIIDNSELMLSSGLYFLAINNPDFFHSQKLVIFGK